MPPQAATPNEEKTSIFISYSRKVDLTFVRDTLEPELQQRGYDVWFDREIQPGDSWWADIFDKICKQVIFVALVREEWFTSPVCNLECQVAREAGKRIIFVTMESHVQIRGEAALLTSLFGRLDNDFAGKFGLEQLKDILASLKLESEDIAKKQSTHEFHELFEQIIVRNRSQELSSQHIIYASENYTVFLEELQTAIDTNFKEERRLSRLLQSVINWEEAKKANKRAGSFLLRGVALNVATNVVESITKSDPRRDLKKFLQFLSVSQQAESRRLRLTLSGSAIVSLILAILSVLLAITAESERLARAETERQVQSLAQSTYSQVLGTETSVATDLGTLVKHGGFLWLTSRDSAISDQWSLLQISIVTSQIERRIELTDETPLPVQQDDRFLWVLMPDDESLMRVDPDRSEQPMQIALEEQYGVMVFSPGRLSSDGIWLIDDSALAYVNSEEGVIENAFELDTDINPASALWLPPYLWAFDEDNHHVLRITPTGDITTIANVQPESQSGRLVAANGRVWLSSSRGLWSIDPSSGEAELLSEVGNILQPPVVDDNTLWLSTEQSVIRLDTDTAAMRRIPMRVPARNIFRFGNRLVIYTVNNAILLLDSVRFEVIASLSFTDTQNLPSPISDGTYLWLANPTVNRIDRVRLEDGLLLPPLINCPNPRRPFVDGATAWLVCRRDNERMELLGIPTNIYYFQQEQPGSNEAVLPPVYDGTNLWIMQESANELLLYDPTLGRVMIRFSTGSNVLPPLFAGGYVWLASSADQSITRYNPDQPGQFITLQLSGEITGMVPIENHLWVSTAGAVIAAEISEPDLFRIHMNSAEITFETNLGIWAYPPTYQQGQLWVTASDSVGGLLYRFDTEDLQQPEVLRIYEQANTAGFGNCPVNSGGWSPTIIDDDIWMTGFPNGFMGGTGPIASDGPLGSIIHVRANDMSLLNCVALIDEVPSRSILIDDQLWFTTSRATQVILSRPNVQDMRQSNLVKFDTSRQILETISMECRRIGMPVAIEAQVWVGCLDTEEQTASINVFDGTNGTLLQTYGGLGIYPNPAQQIGDQVWVSFRDTGSVAVLDLESAQLLDIYRVGNSPTPLIGVNDTVIIANAADGTIQLITPPNSTPHPLQP